MCFNGTEESGLTVVEIAAPVWAVDTPELSTTETPAIMSTLQAEQTAESLQTAAQSAATISENFGTLTIGRKVILIAGNIDEASLGQSPGWMPDSATPSESGMCVILGHRNRKRLRPLEKVKIGDEIMFTYLDGRTVTYTVTETMIYMRIQPIGACRPWMAIH